MIKKVHNPDVLTCIANLSSDEVFTTPSVVNQMLEALPKEFWSDEKATFLDPVSKSGVFLREITKRLIEGLKTKIPNLEDRIEHILLNQVFGIGITELTSLISRRSLYCSKYANGKYSIVKFDDEQGNLKYFETEHTWKNGRCIYCGVNKNYDRDKELENYAYSFIHTNNPNKFFNNMKFDVIIGNPPYQMSDGGGRESSAKPLYNLFVENCIKMNPNYLSMIIPARWYSGGKGLDDFREKILKDTRFKKLSDFPETSDVFPGLNIRGGICYFLWDKNHNGKCEISNYKSNKLINKSHRYLKEGDLETFIRFNEGISILKKVLNKSNKYYNSKVSSRKPFGLPSNFNDFSKKKSPLSFIKLFSVKGEVFVSDTVVKQNQHLISKYKILVSKASPGGDEYPHKIFSEPKISPPNSICTETYLIVDVLENVEQCENLIFYMKTKFFRFLISLIKNTQNISKASFSYVPVLDMNKKWDDEALYNKFGVTQEESEFIDTLIKPM